MFLPYRLDSYNTSGLSQVIREDKYVGAYIYTILEFEVWLDGSTAMFSKPSDIHSFLALL